ncbi:DNA-binding transcriptional LysR family regulator [Caballeronia udeis]|uniref:DNA-binding transcriptional LysR family regulator n=1 Tax=Caballeronia udeis TaxID=1232866 RepID=A0ABW8MCV0_9BURK
MKLELRHIRCFVCVARHLHFARAAEELGIAPPSLTKQIQETEQLLNVRLFHRTKRSVALTAAGEAYLPEALAALAHLSRGQELAALAQRGELGRIEVAYIASAAFAGVLQSTLRGFRKDHPRIEIVLSELAMDRVPAMLAEGLVDVAYVRPPMHFPEGIQAITLYRDHFILAIHEDSPLANSAGIAPAQLRDCVFAVPEQDFGTFEVGRRGRFQPKLGQRPGPLAAVLACVSLGGNVAVVPRTLSDCVSFPGVIYKAITGKPIVSEIAVAFRRHERGPAVLEFIRYAKQL